MRWKRQRKRRMRPRDKEALVKPMDETMNEIERENERKRAKKNNNDKILWINNNEPTIYKQCLNFRSDFIDRVAILFIYFFPGCCCCCVWWHTIHFVVAAAFIRFCIRFGYLKHIGPKRIQGQKSKCMQVSWSFYRSCAYTINLAFISFYYYY